MVVSKITEALEELFKAWQGATKKKEKTKIKKMIEAELGEVVKRLESRWRQADVYDDYEVKRYSM